MRKEVKSFICIGAWCPNCDKRYYFSIEETKHFPIQRDCDCGEEMDVIVPRNYDLLK